MNAKDIIECNACHVCDGELYEGWRVGCGDLIFRAGAEEAVKVKEEEMRLKAIEAHRKICPSIQLNLSCGRVCDRKCKYMEVFINELSR